MAKPKPDRSRSASPAEGLGDSVPGSGVRSGVPARAGEQGRPLSGLRNVSPVRTEERARRAIPTQAPRVFAPGAVAADAVLRPVSWGEAPRIGLLGDTGTGKTTAAIEIVAAYLKLSPGIVLVRDVKGTRSKFRGQEYRDVDELAARRPLPDPRVYVFRGNIWEGIGVDPESIARLQWRMVARRIPSLGVYDEINEAARGGRWKVKDSQIDRAAGQGRAVGLGLLWGSQSPQDTPRSMFEQSNGILTFRLDGLGLNCLRDRNYVLTAELEDVIRSLPGEDVAPADRGQFVLLQRGRPWDRRIYRFPIAG